MALRIIEGKVQGNQSASITTFDEGIFPTCTHVHCNASGTYKLFTDKNEPGSTVDIFFVQGITYPIPCWKATRTDGSLIQTNDLIISWLER